MNTQRASEPPLRRHFAALKAKIASLPAAGDKGSKRVAEAKTKSLPEARARLAELQKVAIQKGIQLPPSFVERPRTLDQARNLIESLERQLGLVGAQVASVIAPPVAEIKPPEEDLISKARALVARSHALSAARTREAVHTAPSAETMSVSELERAIGVANKNGNTDAVSRLYRELRARRAGKPTREISEAVTDLTDGELSLRIQNERDPEKQSMLYKQLAGRRAKG
jgi:hypothetical protein